MATERDGDGVARTNVASMGQRSDLPAPRERAPSPCAPLLSESKAPVGQRNFDVDPSTLDLVFADDEDIFRELAHSNLIKFGIKEENIHLADSGHGALESIVALQTSGNTSAPLVVILDVEMPRIDGRECALQIQELVKAGKLRREPFVICSSSHNRTVTINEGKGNFQLILPKPFGVADLNACLDLLRQWWCMGRGRRLPAWKPFDPSLIVAIVANEEEICRLACVTALHKAGLNEDLIIEVEGEEELNRVCQDRKGDAESTPFMVLLGNPELVTAVEMKNWEPFVICTSVDCDRIRLSERAKYFHAFLPRSFTSADIKWCLDLCRIWWQTRGDGPTQEGSESESDDD